MSVTVFFYFYFSFKVKKCFMTMLSLEYCVPKGFWSDWPILWFNPHFCQLQDVNIFDVNLCKYRRSTYPYMIFKWSKGIVSSSFQSMGDLLQKKLLIADKGTNFFGKIYEEVVLHGKIIYQIMPRMVGCTNAFPVIWTL